MKKKIIISIIIIALIGAGAFYVKNKTQKTDENEKDTVSTFLLKEESITKTIFGDGIIESSETALIYSKFSANFKEVYKTTGDSVEEGEILAVMDTSDLNKALKQAEYQLQLDLDAYEDIKSTGNTAARTSYTNTLNAYNLNKNTYNSNLNLFDEGIISETELNASKSTMDNSYISYLSARDNLNTTALGSELFKYELKLEIDQLEIDSIKESIEEATILAPIAGTITSSIDDAYRLVNNGEVIYEIQNLSSLQVISNISEYEINDTKEGQKVLVTSLGINDKTYNGEIKSISPSANIQGAEVNIEITIDLSDEDLKLRPNFTTNIEIIVASKDKALVVPYEAIQSKGKGKDFIIKLVNDKKEFIPVIRGIESELYIEVLSKDLKAGDVIVIDNPDVKSTGKDMEIRALKKIDGGRGDKK